MLKWMYDKKNCGFIKEVMLYLQRNIELENSILIRIWTLIIGINPEYIEIWSHRTSWVIQGDIHASIDFHQNFVQAFGNY